MRKKVFTFLFLAVFILAQFNIASAALATGVTSIALSSPAFAYPSATIPLTWSFNYTATTTVLNYVFIWSRVKAIPPALPTVWAVADCQLVTTIPIGTLAGPQAGTFTFPYSSPVVSGNDIEFMMMVLDGGDTTCANATAQPADRPVMSTTSIVAQVAGTATLGAIPIFSNAISVQLPWSATEMTGAAIQNVLIWSRIKATPAADWLPAHCELVAAVPLLNSATGTDTFLGISTTADQDVVEFVITLNASDCAAAVPPATTVTPSGSTFIDNQKLAGFHANPPSLSTSAFDAQPVACNTFEMWALMSDQYGNGSTWAIDGYSGLNSWDQVITPIPPVSPAPPASLGVASALLEWKYTLPSTASLNWSFSINPTDFAGNAWTPTPAFFRNALAIVPAELDACKTFTDIEGHASEVYVRYLGDLGIIAGNPNGTYGPDTTLTRAEASVFFAKVNGHETTAGLPTSPPSEACTDVDGADPDHWFAGWVWQACKDGFMNGIGGGQFDPANTFTRGQVVTVFDNMHNKFIPPGIGGTVGGYLDPAIDTVLEKQWGNWAIGTIWPELRQAVWTDVPTGAFYAIPVVRAYGVGVAEGTSATTFSPDQPVLRGEFAKMLYRVLSRTP
jgi:hypothetical protein